MPVQVCPTCQGGYRDLLEHIRKKHPTEPYTKQQLQPLGLACCPICYTACQGTHGVKTHCAKIHGIKGTARVSTQPRARDRRSSGPQSPIRDLSSPPSSPSPAPRSPVGPRAYRGLLGKRLARSPSPPSQRPLRRIRPTLDRSSQPGPSQASYEGRRQPSLRASYQGRQPTRAIPPTLDRLQPGQPTLDLGTPSSIRAPQAASWSPDLPDLPTLEQIKDKVTRKEGPSPLEAIEALSASEAIEALSEASEAPSEGLGAIEVQSLSSEPFSEASSEAIEPNLLREKAPEATEGPIGDKSPLEAQHQQAIAPIVEKGPVKKLLAFSKVPIPEKKLHARHARAFTVAASKAAKAFCKRPTEKALLHFLLLPRVLGLGLQKGGLATLLRNYPANIPTLEDLEATLEQQKSPTLQKNPSKAANPVQRAVKLLERGFLGRASRTLIDPVLIAPNTAANRATLLEKHPIGPEKPFQRKTYPRPGQPVTEATVLKAIASIGKEKAPGLSGWTRPLLDLVTGGDSPVIGFLRLLADMIRQGTAPGAPLLCASRLIGLEKPGGGVRPIAIGDLIYRVAMKAILLTSYNPSMLLPFQLGVNSPGGVEPAIFLLEEAIIGGNSANF
jgi:hypothetical protein